jgi:hypothetical protein
LWCRTATSATSTTTTPSRPTSTPTPTTGAVTNDTVNWSRVRYTGYCLLVIDSEPSQFAGGTSRLKIRGLDEQGGLLDYLEIDR